MNVENFNKSAVGNGSLKSEEADYIEVCFILFSLYNYLGVLPTADCRLPIAGDFPISTP